MKAAILQYKPERAQPQRNLSRILAQCEAAAQAGAKLIHLPEMCLTGYVWPQAAELAPHLEPRQGPAFAALAAFARQAGVHLVYGYGEQDAQGARYNSQNWIAPEGQLQAHYRKRHLFQADLSWARPGNLPFVARATPWGKVGLGICMDLNFDDFVRFHIQQETQILLLAVNWLDEGGPVVDYWLRRLSGFQGHCLIANSHGPEGDISFCGRSCWIYQGKRMLEAGPAGDEILLADLR